MIDPVMNRLSAVSKPDDPETMEQYVAEVILYCNKCDFDPRAVIRDHYRQAHSSVDQAFYNKAFRITKALIDSGEYVLSRPAQYHGIDSSVMTERMKNELKQNLLEHQEKLVEHLYSNGHTKTGRFP